MEDRINLLVKENWTIRDILELDKKIKEFSKKYNSDYKHNQLSTCLHELNFSDNPINFQVWELNGKIYFILQCFYSYKKNCFETETILFKSLDRAVVNFNNEMLKIREKIYF